MSRIMAIDFGLRRIGIAVTDTLQIIATALTTVEAKDCIRFLKEYLSKEQVECVVIGKPVDMHGNNNPLEINIESFIVDLKNHFPAIRIDRMDERFTSKMAQQTILQSGIKKMERRNKSLTDKISAVIILQSYLEFIKK